MSTIRSTTLGVPPDGEDRPEGTGDCGSANLVVKLEGKDVKFELDLSINQPKGKTDKGRSSGKLYEVLRGVVPKA